MYSKKKRKLPIYTYTRFHNITKMSDYEYIIGITGTVMKCERHGIVGKKDGDVDQQEVYRLNIMNGDPGDTIWNRYHNPRSQYKKGINYLTNDRVKTQTPSTEKAYNEQFAADAPQRTIVPDSPEKAELRSQYDGEYEHYSPKAFGGNEALARRRGWMSFDEWFEKIMKGTPLYSERERFNAMNGYLVHEEQKRQQDTAKTPHKKQLRL